MTDDILYTPVEIAEKLKITKGTVYEMIKRGDIDAHRIGKNIRISGTQFETYLLKSMGYENVYEADLTYDNDETIANVGSIKIHVSTKLEGHVKLSVHPKNIILSKGTFVSSARNIHKGIVTNIIQDDTMTKVVLDIGIQITALITTKSLNELNIKRGSELYVIFKTMAVKVYK